MEFRYRLTLCAAIACAAWAAPAMADDVADATIAAKIETAYLFNEHLNPLDVSTSVQDGAVTISGNVDNQIQKDLAERIAKSVTGVKQVTNNVTLGASKPLERREQPWTNAVNDATVTASVRMRLLYQGDLDSDKIQVDTQNNTVTLSGSVASNQEKRRAEEVVRTTRGVRKVVNTIKVTTPKATTQQVREPQGSSENVTTPDTTPQDAQVQEIPATKDAAESDETAGTEAKTDLKDRYENVREQVSETTAEVRERASETAENVKEAASDEWLEKRIEVDLMLSKAVSIWDLDVEVKDGVCVLTGDVDNDAQRQAAERIATGVTGVQRVDNRIRVEAAS